MRNPTARPRATTENSSTLRRHQPRALSLVHITGDLIGDDPSTSVEAARNKTLEWIASPRRGIKLPDAAFEFEPFEIDELGLKAGAVRLRDDRMDYWVARLEHMDHGAVPRTWATEITVTLNDGVGKFGVRLALASNEIYPEHPISIPRVVRDVAATPGLARKGRRLVAQPMIVETENDVDELIALIESPTRTRPVYVASLARNATAPNGAAVDAFSLARQTLGIAHVAVLTGPMSYVLENSVGKEFSVFHRSVRTYRPGCDLFADDPFAHPLARADAVFSWSDGGAEAFERFLVREAAAESVTRIDQLSQLPPYSRVKSAVLALEGKNARNEGDQAAELAALRQANVDLEEEVGEALATAAQEEEEKHGVLERANSLAAENQTLIWRIKDLQAAVAQVSEKGQKPDEIPIPDSLRELKGWADKYLLGRVVVTSKALRAAKNSDFEDVPLVYRSLLALRDYYCEMRTSGTAASRVAWDATCHKLGVEDSKSGERSRLLQQGDEFVVSYNNKSCFLERHLKKGNTRDDRHCMRVYYFWDADTEQVVIGALPGHLKTHLS